MYLNSILYFWGMSEELPVLFGPETQERFDWCFSQALKRREDFVAMLLDKVVIAEPAVAKRPAPSIITSPPTQRKRQKKTCPFAIQQQRAEMGAESVQVICPNDETPFQDDKAAKMIRAVYLNDNVSSLEMQVRVRLTPTNGTRSDFRVWAECSARGFAQGPSLSV